MRAGVCGAVLALLLLFAAPAYGHTLGLSAGEYTARGRMLEVAIGLSRVDAERLGPDLVVVGAEVHVARAGTPCAAARVVSSTGHDDGIVLTAVYECADVDQPFEVDLPLLQKLTRGHLHVAHASGTPDELLYEGHSHFIVPARDPRSRAQAATASPAAPSHPAGTALSYFTRGVEHTLTGYDHLAFLLGLVVLRARRRELVAIVTAFTLAHSLGLVGAAAGLFAPSARFVAPAVALSMVYVGVANLIVKDGRGRWRIAIPFGVLHGLSFAAPPMAPLAALVPFTAGVQIGQLLALALLVPLVLGARHGSACAPLVGRVLSGSLALAGLALFVSRL